MSDTTPQPVLESAPATVPIVNQMDDIEDAGGAWFRMDVFLIIILLAVLIAVVIYYMMVMRKRGTAVPTEDPEAGELQAEEAADKAEVQQETN